MRFRIGTTDDIDAVRVAGGIVASLEELSKPMNRKLDQTRLTKILELRPQSGDFDHNPEILTTILRF